MKTAGLSMVVVLAFAGLSRSAFGDELSYTRMATFVSDLNDDVTLNFPTFNSQDGTLLGVEVSVRHSGSVDVLADNDDPFQSTTANARMIRAWQANGPGVAAVGSKTVTTNPVFLDADDGDGFLFDSSPPDGTEFGGFNYPFQSAGVFNPDPGPYTSDGPGSVDYLVDVLLMINDLQFEPKAPDQWQLEVENPLLQVEVTVTYTFIPEPASLALLAVGGLALLRRRRVS